MDPEVLTWLLEDDPSVRWQTQRDLGDAPRPTWEKSRSLIASEGWGQRLLDFQDPEGTWGGGLYTPKWISTTYTLLLLRRFGLDNANQRALIGSRLLLDKAEWVDGGVSYWTSRPLAERCVNGMVLSITSWFDTNDDRIDDIAELLMSCRLRDGGWNCRDWKGDKHSSFHTTISVLEGLLQWKRRRQSDSPDDALATGHEFLLRHHMFRSHTTGAVVNKDWTRFYFPPRWYYDILRGLDHMRDAGVVPDDRAAEAIDIVRSGEKNGRWPVGPRHPNRVFFRMEDGRSPGRWNTLRALRTLKWWESVA